jgi:hypothetical protein
MIQMPFVKRFLLGLFAVLLLELVAAPAVGATHNPGAVRSIDLDLFDVLGADTRAC